MNKELPPGIAIKMELGMRFVKWADGLRRAPSRDEVMAEFAVGQSTAYRYLTAYRNVCEAMNARVPQ